jgi:chloride channel protein, CIC family
MRFGAKRSPEGDGHPPVPAATLPLHEDGRRRVLRWVRRAVLQLPGPWKWIVLGALIGVAAGLGGVVFYLAIGWSTELFQGGIAGYVPPQPSGEGSARVTSASRWWLLPVATTLGGLLVGILATRLAPETEGNGTDVAIAAFHHGGGRMRFRAPLMKLPTSAITLGSGGSGGRERPTTQIGAGFGSWLGHLLDLDLQDRRIALAAGMGSGIAAIFRAPLGGTILGAELLYRRDFETQALLPSLVACIVAYTLFSAIFGWTPIFAVPSGLGFTHPLQLLYYAALGLAVAIAGIGYIRVFHAAQDLFAGLRLAAYLKPALGGLAVGLIGLAVPEALGVGAGWVQVLINPGHAAIPLTVVLLLPLIKILTTSLSIGSGGSGGLVGPGLVIGAAVGASFWEVFHQILPGMPATATPFVVVAMMSLFGAVAHAPIGVMVMVAEMTASYPLLAPAMITVSVACFVVGDRGIYRSQLVSRNLVD